MLILRVSHFRADGIYQRMIRAKDPLTISEDHQVLRLGRGMIAPGRHLGCKAEARGQSGWLIRAQDPHNAWPIRSAASVSAATTIKTVPAWRGSEAGQGQSVVRRGE